MTWEAAALLAVFLSALLVTVKPMGLALAAVAEGRFSARPLARLDTALARFIGVRPDAEMDWLRYALALLVFNALGFFVLYALQRVQAWLPLNPQSLGNVAPDSAFNTAVSFVTNTNWQGYAGESTMSYLTQMAGLAVQNFLSAATGIAVAFALIRGLARHSVRTVGNFWLDLTRVTVFILVPLSFVLALALVSQGVMQNFSPYVDVALVEPTTKVEGDETVSVATQTLAMGPVASQEAIKELGTNGGGFMNANSAHPYENPNALTNFLQMLAIFLIPAGLTYAFGRMVGDTRQGWAVFAAMAVMFVGATVAVMSFEQQGNPAITALGVDAAASAEQPGGNMEGKESRFGVAASALFAAITTAASCGAVNSMHDSYTPLGGLVPMLLMQLGEVVFGGVGSGLYGMLVFALLAVFLAGLMIGRTPEYLGKKIEAYEMKMVSIAILVTPLLVLVGTAIAVLTEAGRSSMQDGGPHGFSEVLYAVSSAANNNGSAFAGLSANTPFYNALLGIAMWLGRFAIIVPVLALAGSLAAKKRLLATEGSMPTHGPLFVGLLIGTVLLIGALTYLPALALGPVVEHLLLWNGR